MKNNGNLRKFVTIKLAEEGIRQKDLARVLGRSEASLSRAISNQSPALLKQLVAIKFLTNTQAKQYLLASK